MPAASCFLNLVAVVLAHPSRCGSIVIMLHELATAGPVFWIVVGFFALFVIGYTMETLRKRRLEIDIQKKLDRDLSN
jgi:hypothetical protein